MVSGARSRGRRARRSSRQGGYSLVILVMIFTTMSVLAAAALPAIEQTIRRNKEEELIFRGFQYAEAIRVFQRRYSRYPVRLDELIQVKPRCIRQLWKDPMTDDGKWGIITLNNGPARRGPGQQNPAPGQDPEGANPQPNPGDAEQNPDQADDGQMAPGQVPANLPILGVFSKSHKTAVKTLFGKERYDEWRFTADTLRTPFGVGPGGAVSRAANATWIGRPFRQGLAQPGGQPAGGMPGAGVGNPTPRGGGQGQPPHNPVPDGTGSDG